MGKFTENLRKRRRIQRVVKEATAIRHKQAEAIENRLGCEHGRLPGQPCPHCLGIGERPLTEAEAIAITMATDAQAVRLEEQDDEDS